jgi:hypothetical protein
MDKKYFILGAPDPEMVTIEGLLKAHGVRYGYATLRGRVVQAHEAYRADGTTTLIPSGSEIVVVECSVLGLHPVHYIDHHREGDPGFGLPPDQYLEGSSLGQFLAYMGIPPTQEHRVIAAADHCLTHAYHGRCPGVDVQELKLWRTRNRATARGLAEEELSRQIAAATEYLQSVPRIKLAGVDVAFVDEIRPEIAEASAREGIPYTYVKKEPDGRRKAGILSAPPEAIQEWMDTCQLQNIYGDPQRGFAGGYFEALQ